MSSVGRLVSVAVGDRPGLSKRPVTAGRLVAGHGLEGDRHAGPGPRQLSMLDASVVDALLAGGAAVGPGALGENLLVDGIALDELPLGARLKVGAAVLEITQARPVCRSVREVDPRALPVLAGRPGKMARVILTGEVHPGDPVEALKDETTS